MHLNCHPLKKNVIEFVVSVRNGNHVMFAILLGGVCICLVQNIDVVRKVWISSDVSFGGRSVAAKSDMSEPV